MGMMGTWEEASSEDTCPGQERVGLGVDGRAGGCWNHLGLYCKVEGASFEGQHGAIVVSCSFWKNPDSHLRRRP